MLRLILQTMRPKQWTKNAFVFAGLLFSKNIFQLLLLGKVIAAFLLFCAVSGSVYIINDIIDAEKDRNHPEKKKRPIASGKLGRIPAGIIAGFIIILSFFSAFLLHTEFGIICLVYFFMNLGYSFYLKNQVIVDVLTIAVGFVLRAVAGAVVIDVEISPWLLVCTLLLALFLGLCKRRNELMLANEMPSKHRLVLEEYSDELLDQMIAVVTASAFMSYALYTISEKVRTEFHTTNLQFTIPFVLFGIFRYLYLVHKKNLGGSPELILLSDKPMIIDLSLWILSVTAILYFS